MKKILIEIFTDANGKISSKRVFGAIGFITSIIAICLKVDTESIRFLLITSAGLIGLGIGENIMSKIKK